MIQNFDLSNFKSVQLELDDSNKVLIKKESLKASNIFNSPKPKKINNFSFVEKSKEENIPNNKSTNKNKTILDYFSYINNNTLNQNEIKKENKTEKDLNPFNKDNKEEKEKLENLIVVENDIYHLATPSEDYEINYMAYMMFEKKENIDERYIKEPGFDIEEI